MLPSSFAAAAYSSNFLSDSKRTGVVDAIGIQVEDIGVGTLTGAAATDAKEKAARLILEALEIEITRTLPNGQSIKTADDVTGEFFRSYANHTGGYAHAVDGAMLYVGRNELDRGKSKLSIELDWSGTDESSMASDIDLSSAKIVVRTGQRLAVAQEHLVRYIGQKLSSDDEKLGVEVDNLTDVFYYNPAGDDELESHIVTIGSNSMEYPAGWTRHVSALEYQHENENKPALLHLYDAQRRVARSTVPELRVKTTSGNGRIVQVGTLVRNG